MEQTMMTEHEDSPVAIPEGDGVAALEAYRALVLRRPGDVQARVRFARLLELHGQSERALAELDRSLAEMPDEPTLLCARGLLLSAMLRYERAEADLRRSLKLQESVDVLTGLGNLACRRGKWREGLEPLRRASELDPNHSPAFYLLGEVYSRIDQYLPALSAYERSAQLDPANWRALKGMGNVLDRLKRPAEAAQAHRRALDVQRRLGAIG